MAVINDSDHGEIYYSCHANMKLKIRENVYLNFTEHGFITADESIQEVLEKMVTENKHKPFNARIVMSEADWNEWQYQLQEQAKNKNNDAKNWKLKIN
jgi:hypothetical protein